MSEFRYTDANFIPINENPYKELFVRKIVEKYVSDIKQICNYDDYIIHFPVTISPSDVMLVQNEEVYIIQHSSIAKLSDVSSAAFVIDVILEGGAGALIEQEVRAQFIQSSKLFITVDLTHRFSSRVFKLTIK